MFVFDFLAGYLTGYLLGITSAAVYWGAMYLRFRRTTDNSLKDNLKDLRELREISDQRDRELAEFIAEVNTRLTVGQAESSQTAPHPD